MTTVLLHPTILRRLPDEELVDLVRGGDDRAYEAVVERYRAALVAFARQRLGGAHHDAEECVQDAPIRALGRTARHRPRHGAQAVAVRDRRQPLPRRAAPPRAHDGPRGAGARLGDGDGDPHARAVGREELAALVTRMSALPARQRRALMMHELEGRSHADIARRLRVSTGATKALVCRARAGLAEARAVA